MEEIAQGLELTGHFLARDIFTDRSRPLTERARGSSSGCAALVDSPR